MKKPNINIFVSLIFFLHMVSCAGKIIKLEKNNYALSKYANLNVRSLKQKGDEIKIILLGISLEKEEVVIRKDEIQCGAGNEFFESVTIKGVSDDFIIFPKSTFTEFRVICTKGSSRINKGSPFLIFKKIYNFKNNGPDKIIGSDLKIEFK